MRTALGLALAVVLTAVAGIAQGPSVARFSGATQNVSGAGESIRINVYEWSTDAQRDAFVAAWTLTRSAAAPAGRGAGGAGGAGGARGARGARGGATPAGRGAAPRGAGGRGAAAPSPAVDDGPAAEPATGLTDLPQAGPARGGRGGRGGGAAASTPEGSLGAALKAAPTIGIFWTSEALGYAIKYARRIELSGGAERIILATDRLVGISNDQWKPAQPVSSSEYPFSLIELRVTSAGKGNGKGVVTGKVAVDAELKTIVLDGYDSLPVILQVERAR